MFFISVVALSSICTDVTASSLSIHFDIVVYPSKNVDKYSTRNYDTAFENRKGTFKEGKKINLIPKREELTKGFNAKGFFLALFLNVYGLIYVYFTSIDKNEIRWAWRGFAASILLIWIVVGLVTILSLP